MTETLYDDGLLTEFQANVTECICKDGKYWIALDTTAFYVESGGMDSDTGTLNHLQVLELHEENHIIYHVVEEELHGMIIGRIDARERLKKIQVHTAQHLLSYLMMHHFQAKTTSHHVYSEQQADIEFDIPNFTMKEAKIIQKEANAIIDLDYSIDIFYPSKVEASQYAPIEKLQHDILRVVSIGGLDYNLCGCLHVPSTLWIKGIVITKVSKGKQGIRLEYIAGNSAFDYMDKRIQVLEECTSLLAMPHLELAEGIHKLQDSSKDIIIQNGYYKNAYFDLLVDIECKSLDLSHPVYLIQEYHDLEVKDLQNIVARYMQKDNIILAAILHKVDGMHIILAYSKTLQLRNAKDDFSYFVQECGYKGGGNPNLAQGGGPKIENIKQVINTLWNLNEN